MKSHIIQYPLRQSTLIHSFNIFVFFLSLSSSSPTVRYLYIMNRGIILTIFGLPSPPFSQFPISPPPPPSTPPLSPSVTYTNTVAALIFTILFSFFYILIYFKALHPAHFEPCPQLVTLCPPRRGKGVFLI